MPNSDRSRARDRFLCLPSAQSTKVTNQQKADREQAERRLIEALGQRHRASTLELCDVSMRAEYQTALLEASGPIIVAGTLHDIYTALPANQLQLIVEVCSEGAFSKPLYVECVTDESVAKELRHQFWPRLAVVFTVRAIDLPDATQTIVRADCLAVQSLEKEAPN